MVSPGKGNFAFGDRPPCPRTGFLPDAPAIAKSGFPSNGLRWIAGTNGEWLVDLRGASFSIAVITACCGGRPSDPGGHRHHGPGRGFPRERSRPALSAGGHRPDRSARDRRGYKSAAMAGFQNQNRPDPNARQPPGRAALPANPPFSQVIHSQGDSSSKSSSAASRANRGPALISRIMPFSARQRRSSGVSPG